MKRNRSAACVALLGLLLSTACAYAPASARSAAPTDAEEAASVARATLARLPPAARLGEIRDERLRRAVQSTYDAVVELAENREPGRLDALSSKFERAYASVVRETARGEHKTCAANCKALDGEPCLAKCKTDSKKFCGCRLVVFGCIVAECIF